MGCLEILPGGVGERGGSCGSIIKGLVLCRGMQLELVGVGRREGGRERLWAMVHVIGSVGGTLPEDVQGVEGVQEAVCVYYDLEGLRGHAAGAEGEAANQGVFGREDWVFLFFKCCQVNGVHDLVMHDEKEICQTLWLSIIVSRDREKFRKNGWAKREERCVECGNGERLRE